MQRFKSSPADDLLVRDKTARPVDRTSAITRLVFDGFNDIEPLLADMLKDDSYLLRAQAVKALIGSWGRSEYLNDAKRLLRSDPEWLVRSDAAFALSQYAQKHREQQQYIAEELARQLVQDGDSEVQKNCYQELLRLLAPDRDWLSVPDYFNRERDVDWGLLKPYLDESQIPEGQLTR